MKVWLISFVGYCIPFLLHSMGLYLLSTKTREISPCQKLYLVNLSISEILLSLTGALFSYMLAHYGENHLGHKISMIAFLATSFPYYIIMVVLTIDRFGQVYLNVRYSLHWSEKHTKYTMAFVWISTFIVGSLFLTYLVLDTTHACKNLNYFCFTFLFPLFDFMVAVITIITYTYIMKRLQKTRRVSSMTTSLQTEETIDSVKNTPTESKETKKDKKRRRDKFMLLPTLLILTFILFIEIPDLIQFFSNIGIIYKTTLLEVLCNLTYAVGYISDALIYVLLSTTFKRWLKKKLRRISSPDKA